MTSSYKDIHTSGDGWGINRDLDKDLHSKCVLITIGIIMASFLWMFSMMPYWLRTHPEQIQHAGGDMMVYQNAANGWIPPIVQDSAYTYLYPKPTIWFFGWSRWMSAHTAYLHMLTASLFAYVLVLNKLLRIPFGWVVALITLKPVLLDLWSGNVQIILYALCLSPWTMAIAVGFKFYFAGVVIAYVAAQCYDSWKITTVPTRYYWNANTIIHSRLAWCASVFALAWAFLGMWLK
jgi:hypothetical protein